MCRKNYNFTLKCLNWAYVFSFPGCDKRPVRDKELFEQHVGDGIWVIMPCAPGTAFSEVHCRCSKQTWVKPGFGKRLMTFYSN